VYKVQSILVFLFNEGVYIFTDLPNVEVVLESVKSVMNEYYWIGTQLGLSSDILEKKLDSDLEQHMKEILSAWLKEEHNRDSSGASTWKKLCDALESIDPDLSDKIASEHIFVKTTSKCEVFIHLLHFLINSILNC
jgi:hypothetical protein